MRSMSFSKSVLLGLTVAAAAFVAQGAQATINITDYTQDKGSVGGTIHWDNPYGNDVNVNAGIGRFVLTGTDAATNKAVSYQSYCVDIFQYVTKPMSFSVSSLTDYLSSYGSNAATKANQLNALIANGNAGVGNATSSAAMQLAVWEILYEYTSTTSYSLDQLSNTAFWSTGSGVDFSTAKSLANSYVGKVTSNVWKTDASYTLSVLKSDTAQDQLVFTRSAVPEPATWAMMLAGFGGIGAMLRRRRPAGGLVRIG